MSMYRLYAIDPREQHNMHPDDKGKYIHYGVDTFLRMLARALTIIAHGGKVAIVSCEFARKHVNK